MKKSSKAAHKRAVQRKFKSMMILSFVIISFVTIVVLSSAKTAQAEEAVSLNKYYKTIVIQPNDSLWSIAKENTNGRRSEISRFISEVGDINGIGENELRSGMKLIIPYYSE